MEEIDGGQKNFMLEEMKKLKEKVIRSVCYAVQIPMD